MDKPLFPRYLFVITGPAGCGKTSVAQFLRSKLGVVYIEGDDYHPPSNIEKMAKGLPLTDSDRWDWLINLRDQAINQFKQGATTIILTCSALKQKYRDVFRVAKYFDSLMCLRFLYLCSDRHTLIQRVVSRQGHFMQGNMVESQLSCLEEPDAGELDISRIPTEGDVPEISWKVAEVLKDCWRGGIVSVKS